MRERGREGGREGEERGGGQGLCGCVSVSVCLSVHLSVCVCVCAKTERMSAWRSPARFHALCQWQVAARCSSHPAVTKAIQLLACTHTHTHTHIHTNIHKHTWTHMHNHDRATTHSVCGCRARRVVVRRHSCCEGKRSQCLRGAARGQREPSTGLMSSWLSIIFLPIPLLIMSYL